MRLLSVMVLSSAVLGAQDHAGQCTRGYTCPPATARTTLYSTAKPIACSHELRVAAVVSNAGLHIVSPARMESIADANLTDGAFMLMCDELDLVPATNVGEPVGLHGVGNVLVKTSLFTARAARISKQADQLVLEADGATKAQLTQVSSQADQRGFSLTAERITLDLSLDHIAVDGGTVIKLAAPVLPDSTVQTAVPR